MKKFHFPLKYKLLILMPLFLALTACYAANGAAFKPLVNDSSSNAPVYVYRDKSVVGGSTKFKVAIDGKNIGTLAHNGYLASYATAGNHTLQITKPGEPLIPSKTQSYPFRVTAKKPVYVLVNSYKSKGGAVACASLVPTILRHKCFKTTVTFMDAAPAKAALQTKRQSV